MLAVGIDVSKGKSTIAILNENGEIVEKPFVIFHNDEGFNKLIEKVKLFPKKDVRFLLEATGHFHYPIAFSLLQQEYWVCIENALTIKKYCDTDLRNAKTDKKDALKLAHYLLEKWFKLKPFQVQESSRNELLFLSREYSKYTTIQSRLKIQLTELVDLTFPGIKSMIDANNRFELFLNIYEKYWHPDLILAKTEQDFIFDIENMAKKLGHKVGLAIGKKLYDFAPTVIPSRPNNEITQLAITNCLVLLRQNLEVTNTILSKMNEIASTFEEFSVVSEMKGVGVRTGARLIAEIGDVRKFKSANSLIAFCGIDTPPYQSGSFKATQRHISKRGNKNLRKVGFEIMRNLKISRPKQDNSVYEYILKKETEGKAKKVAKIAGLNKFLRIYYARVMEVYKQ